MSHKRSLASRRQRRKQKHRRRDSQRDYYRVISDSGETTGDAKFARPETCPCPDCNLDNRLRTVDLQPIRIGSIPLRPSRVSKWRPLASKGCETCKGTGKVHLDFEYERKDPYDLTTKESREALEQLRLWRARGGKDTRLSTAVGRPAAGR